ncbi:GNAT family N-acetyltransferase [Aeromicrobium sp.]|uniref:GNAT family N-acetyltransferase n=1 Tax=Aeromicrobium sp. TaxID=1871063 RepID=UPI0030BCA7A4
MKVIRAQLADITQAAPLFAAYREFYGEPYDLESSATFLVSRLARDQSIVLIARDDADAPVGFAQIYPAFSSTRLAPIWILNDLFVAEQARGTGAADALLETASKLAVEAGVIAIELATAHTNLRAQAVYDRSGYAVDEVYQHYAKQLP